LVAVLIGVDILMLLVAFALASFLRFEALPYYHEYSPAEYSVLVSLIVPAWLILFALFRLYDPHVLFGGTQEYARLFNATALGALGLVVVGFFVRDDGVISRGWLVLSSALAFLLVAVARTCVRTAVFMLRARGHLLSPALVVGANEEGQALADQLRHWQTSGLDVVGSVVVDELSDRTGLADCPTLGVMSDLDRLVAEHHIEELIVAPTALSRNQLVELFRKYGVSSAINVRLSSGLFEVMTTGLEVKELGYVPLISVRTARIQGLDAVLKRLLDIAVALPGLIVLAPIFAVIAVAIKLDSRGPVFYRRRVLGSGGRAFDAYKLRTMVTDGEQLLDQDPGLRAQLAREGKLRNDPRVTRLGRAMRRFSVDELPQLVNVLRGQMSLVGPRMISPSEMAEYGKWGMNLVTVKPGLTGLWQVSGRAEVPYQERVRLDMHYIRNWSIWLDLQLLLRTIPAVLRGKGAY
jgi:exopolysaccharide biosynthesis polyprenyl glycosylphosphotransferase